MATTAEIWQKHFGNVPAVAFDGQGQNTAIEKFFDELNTVCLQERLQYGKQDPTDQQNAVARRD